MAISEALLMAAGGQAALVTVLIVVLRGSCARSATRIIRVAAWNAVLRKMGVELGERQAMTSEVARRDLGSS